MKVGRINGRKIINPRKQRGVVLLIALIILVAMTLAGIGMMRSVDTGSVIAGNLAFQQATMQANDEGTAIGFNALTLVANTANSNDKTLLRYSDNQPCSNAPGATAAGCPAGSNINFPGYRSTPFHSCEVDQSCMMASDSVWWKDDNQWVNAPTITVSDPGNPTVPIATVSYWIHRMCRNAGASSDTGQLCQTYTQPATGCSKSVPPQPCKSKSLFYRITTRSTGPRNTVTYAQTLVLIQD